MSIKPHLDAIAREIGLEDPAHQPAQPRGIFALLGDMENAIHAMQGRRFSLFVLRADDLQAVISAMKCAQIVQAQQQQQQKQQRGRS